MTHKPDGKFRKFQGEADYEIIRSIFMASSKADQTNETATLDGIKNWCAPTDRFNPRHDLLFALDTERKHAYTEIGFSRVSWYTGKEGTRLYTQTSYLLPEYRGQGAWSELVMASEGRLQEIASSHASTPERYFQAWATESQKDWISVVENEGYKAVRHFHNMLHPLNNIPVREMPKGLDVHPAKKEHFRSIWEAQREVQAELFEYVAEHWSDDNYNAWLHDTSHTPELWQVAWDGDQVAGMVLPRINEAENHASGRKRGYAENVFVRKPWRKRGLAGALMTKSLQILKTHGMVEVELGVDTENDSNAFAFYERMGFKTFSTDIWFRKAMH